MVSEQTKGVVQVPSLDQIKIGGHTGKIVERVFHERVFSEFARNVAYKEAEDAFRNRIDDADPSGGIWQGEYWGKHMLSACEVYRYTKDEDLLAFIRKAAETLISLQRTDGYIGTYRNSSNWFVIPKDEPNGPEGPYRGWNWNIWCRKYTLWGLLECYDVTGDKKILDAANRHGLQLLDELEATGTDIADTGTFVGMPSCSIIKPMLTLYGHTKNQRILNFAISVAENWERPDNKCPNLIANALSAKPISGWYPNSEKWAKAYEMMSCFEGLIALYRVTGCEKYLDAVKCFYEILMKHEWNPVCSVAYNDMFGDAASEINAISEPCDAIHFMRICYELYLLTGEARYMDTFEKTFFNAFLAGVFSDGKWGARGVRGAGRHFYVDEQAKFLYNHCCVNNMPRAFATMARCAVAKRGADVVVNLYENTEIRLDGVKVTVGGSYFADGKATVCVEFDGVLGDVLLRIPGWCDGAVIEVDGSRYEPASGYFRLKMRKRSALIHMDFRIQPKIHAFSGVIPNHTEDEWYVKRFVLRTSVSPVPEELYLRENRVFVTYGPLLLAKSKLVGTAPDVRLKENGNCRAEVLPSGDVRTKLRLTYTDEIGFYQITVCDYASAGNEKLKDPAFFSIYF